MLGKYILYVDPQTYALAIRLIFETMSFKGIRLIPLANEYTEMDR